MNIFWILALIYTVSATVVVLLFNLEDAMASETWPASVKEVVLGFLALFPVLNFAIAVVAITLSVTPDLKKADN